MHIESALRSFICIVEAGNVTAASRILAIPRPTVSRHLAQLEGHYSAVLLRRTTRRQTLTEAGKLVYERGRSLLSELDALSDRVQSLHGQVSGTLRVSVPPGMRQPMLIILTICRARHPLMEIEVIGSTEFVDLVADGFDVAIRAGTLADSALRRRHLFRSPRGVVAAPAYLKRAGVPETARDLQKHQCIIGTVEGRHPEISWPLTAGGQAPVSGPIRTNDLGLRMQLALAGEGLTLLPLMLVAPAIADGRLVPVLADLVGDETTLSAVYLDQKPADPRVQAFLDVATKELRQLFDDPKRREEIGRQELGDTTDL